MPFQVQKQGPFDNPDEWRVVTNCDTQEESDDYIQSMRDYQDDSYTGAYFNWRVVEVDGPCETCGGDGEVEVAIPYYGCTNAYLSTKPCPDCREVYP